MSWCEQKYINLISSRLRNFKWKQSRLANFSCVYCGDSATKKTKARGYFYEKSNLFFYKCHNCLISTTFGKFLQNFDEDVYREYCFEAFAAPFKKEELKVPKSNLETYFKSNEILIDKLLERIDKLPDTHEAVVYLKKRLIPASSFDRIYYIDNIKDIVQLNPKYAEKITTSEPRILFPTFNNNGHLAGLSARAIREHPIRYLNLHIDEDFPHVFGCERLKRDETFFVFEGPIDSIFLKNSIAVSCASFVEPFERLGLNKEKAIFVYDNEPRNRDILRAMQRSINKGYKVCIWGDGIIQKDINDMVLSGINVTTIERHILEHSYTGISASLLLNKWRKVVS